MKKYLLASLLFIALTAHGAEITVFAAASLADVLQQLGTTFQSQTGDHVSFNFAGSSTLARQIEQGAPADVFVSADEAKVDELGALVLAGTRHSFLSNTLVIVRRADYKLPLKSAADLAQAGLIALAEPGSVPAGIYAREYLKKNGLWKTLQPKVVPTENVRAALASVDSGNADAAFVYKTDAAMAKSAKIAVEIPAAYGPKISYALAVLKAAPQPETAKKFAEFLASEKARAVFKEFGFLIPPPRP